MSAGPVPGGGRELHHLCLKVSDLEEAARWLAGLYGAGPFFAREPGPFDEIEYGPGGPCVLEHAIAFGMVGDQLVELKVPVRAEPPALEQALSQGPVNHIAYPADDFDGECARIESDGGELIVRARTGPFQLAYHKVPFVGVVETLRACDELAGMKPMMAAAATDWDGSDPIRWDQFG